MGIFSDVCECGNRVSKRARFCNACGKPAPGGWWKCPACGKWVANDAHYCSHCNTPLYPEDRVNIAGGVWQKQPVYYAQRFEAGDIKRELVKSLQVQEGTAAILMDAGEVNAVLDAGAHDIDSLARRINWFGNPPPRSVVLIDVGEVVVPLHIEGLRTSEHFPLEFYGEVILKFRGGKDAARAFVSNILKGERECTFDVIAKRLEPVLRGPVDEMCTVSTLDDLVRDPERRIRLQERMDARIKEDLAACGVDVVRVSSAEFTGDEYEAYAEKLGQVDQERRDIEYRAALRRMADGEEMSRYKDADQLRNYKETIDHEYRVSHETREREFALLKREWAHDDIKYQWLLELETKEHQHKLENVDQSHQHAMEDRQVDHDIANSIKMDDYARGKKVADAQSDVAAQDKHSQQDIKDAYGWLGVKAKKQELRQQDKAADASRRSGMGIDQLLADIDDPQQREDMLKMYQMQLQSGMSPEQILATKGLNHYGPEYQQFMQRMADLYKDNADRSERELSRMLAALKVNISGSVSQGVNYSASSTQSSNSTNQNRTDVSSYHESWQDLNLPKQS